MSGDAGLGVIATRGSGRSADADTDANAGLNSVVGVNVVDIAAGGVLINATVIEHRRVIDALTLNANGDNTWIRPNAVDRPRNRDRLSGAGCAGSRATGRQNGVSHATRVAIKYDIFHDAYFLATRVFNFHPNDFARLNVAGRS